jgi:pectin methylesterase-like acyl-CoA thioesterase
MWGEILEGLGTAATIWNQYQANQNQQDQTAQVQANADRNFGEEQRQFDLQHKLALMKLEAPGGGGGGAGMAAQIQANHSRAMQGAYQTLIEAVESGRTGEANALMAMVDRIQKAYGSA